MIVAPCPIRVAMSMCRHEYERPNCGVDRGPAAATRNGPSNATSSPNEGAGSHVTSVHATALPKTETDGRAASALLGHSCADGLNATCEPAGVHTAPITRTLSPHRPLPLPHQRLAKSLTTHSWLPPYTLAFPRKVTSTGQ